LLEDRIEKYWDNRSVGYSASVTNAMHSFKKNAWQSLIKSFAPGGKAVKALDVGTGPGFFAIIMAELGYEVTAVDVSDEMLLEARKNTAHAGFKVSLMKSDVQKINQPGENFDLIVSRNLVWTLTNPLAAYKEWHRLLKPEGRVLVFDANWYLRLTNSELQKQYEHCRRTAREKGFADQVSEEQHRECEEIARKLPLTYEARPDWDRKAFAECGFKEVIIQENLNELVYDDIEKILYEPTPMFAVCACK